MTERFWVGGDGNWDASDTTHWAAISGGAGGQSVPTLIDNVTFDSTSNATAYTVSVSGSVDCANLTFGNPTAGVLTFNGSQNNVFGNLSFANGMVCETLFVMSATSLKTITSNGTLLPDVSLKVDGVAGTAQLVDHLTVGTITLTHGTFDLNNKNVTSVNLLTSGSGIRTLTLGSGVLNLTASGGSVFNATTSTNLTVTATTGTIRFTTTEIGTAVFAGGGKTYGILDVTAGGPTTVGITGANTFTRITVTGVGGKTFSLAGVTQTLTGTTPIPSGLDAGNQIVFVSEAPATLSCSNPVSVRHVSLTNIVADGSTPFLATASVDGGGNTNWSFVPDNSFAMFTPYLL